MKRILLFDLDGTLTPARSQMTVEMINFLDKFTDNDMYIVTGSDFNKIKEQVPEFILRKFKRIYACMGNTVYDGQTLEYLSGSPEIVDPKLDKELKSLFYYEPQYYTRYKNNIEYRPGMINFSFLGRDCPFSEREKYFEWDKENSQRKSSVAYLKNNFPDYDFELGGKISIDIIKKGHGKDQVVNMIKSLYKEDININFFGDRTFEGGNDYSVAEATRLSKGAVYQVSDDKETLKILSNI